VKGLAHRKHHLLLMETLANKLLEANPGFWKSISIHLPYAYALPEVSIVGHYWRQNVRLG